MTNIVTGEECPCINTETSITSLHSDTSQIVNSSETNSIQLKTEDKENDRGEKHFQKDTDYKYHEDPAMTHYKMPKPTEATYPKMECQQESLNEPPMIKFESALPCFCHAHRIAYTLPVKYTKGDSDAKPFWCHFNWKRPRKEYLDKKAYEVKLKETQCSHYAKPFMYCEISEGMGNKNISNIANGKPPKYQTKLENSGRQIGERIDVYYFDHGNSAYYRTTDSPPILATEKCAEKTDQAATRFWAEIFGTVHIGTAFVTAFILQFLRFILFSIIRPLTVGILQLIADYFIKPFLSIVFNALIQPILILFYNIATSLKDLCEPLAEAIGLFLKEIANLCRAIRIVEVKCPKDPSTSTCT